MRSLVVNPPTFRIVGGQYDREGKVWKATVQFSTLRGPVCVEVCMSLPEALKDLYHHVADKMILAAAGHCGASVGFDWNPIHAVSNVASAATHAVSTLANDVHDMAKKAADTAISALPGPLGDAAHYAVDAIYHATNPTELTNALKHAGTVLSGVKIPGTDIPLAALNPIGAGVVAARKILGDNVSDKILSTVFETVLGPDAGRFATDVAMRATGGSFHAALPGFPSGDFTGPQIAALAASAVKDLLTSGAIVGLMPSLVVAKAGAVATLKASDPAFAKEVGIPTLAIDESDYSVARKLVPFLRALYNKDPRAIATFQTLGLKAASNDAKARRIWLLANSISNQANRAAMEARQKAARSFREQHGESFYSMMQHDRAKAIAIANQMKKDKAMAEMHQRQQSAKSFRDRYGESFFSMMKQDRAKAIALADQIKKEGGVVNGFVGDGYGFGYGQAGYLPAPLPVHRVYDAIGRRLPNSNTERGISS